MSNMRVKDIRPAPAEIEYKNMKFLITDRPNDQTIHTFIQVRPNLYVHIKMNNITNKKNNITTLFSFLLGTEKAQCERSSESL